MSKKTSFQVRYRGIVVNVTIDNYNRADAKTRVDMVAAIRKVLQRDTVRHREVKKPAKIQPKRVKKATPAPVKKRKQSPSPNARTQIVVQWTPSMAVGSAPRLAPRTFASAPLIKVTPVGQPEMSRRTRSILNSLPNREQIAVIRGFREEARSVRRTGIPTEVIRHLPDGDMIFSGASSAAASEAERLRKRRAALANRLRNYRGGR
jgi:hypothetical protein